MPCHIHDPLVKTTMQGKLCLPEEEKKRQADGQHTGVDRSWLDVQTLLVIDRLALDRPESDRCRPLCPLLKSLRF